MCYLCNVIDFNNITDDTKIIGKDSFFTNALLYDRCVDVLQDIVNGRIVPIGSDDHKKIELVFNKSNVHANRIDVEKLVFHRYTSLWDIQRIYNALSPFYDMLCFERIEYCYIDDDITQLENLPSFANTLLIEGCWLKNLDNVVPNQKLIVLSCTGMHNLALPEWADQCDFMYCFGLNFDKTKSTNIKCLYIMDCNNCKNFPIFNKLLTLKLERLNSIPHVPEGSCVCNTTIEDCCSIKGCPKSNTLTIVGQNYWGWSKKTQTKTGYEYIPGTKYENFEGIPETVTALIINAPGVDFPIEPYLPKNLKILSLDRYYIRDKHGYKPENYEWPAHITHIFLGDRVSKKFFKFLENKYKNTDVKIQRKT